MFFGPFGDDIKGTLFQQIEGRIIYWPSKNNLYFFLSSNVESTLNGEKSIKIEAYLGK